MLKGIDVSEHNQVIDWDKVKADGIQFAMIHMGYGSDITSQDDKQFERNVAEAERVGISWGPYLYSYALNIEQAKSEKEHALRLLKGKKPTYPVAFDMEDADGYKERHGMPTNEVLVDICDTFLNAVEAEGHYVVLYASKDWLDNQLNSSKLDRYNKWVAQWNDHCTYDKIYCLWQYSNAGTVNGISGRVDMNYCNIDFAAPVKVEAKHEEPVKPVAAAPTNDVYMHIVQAGENLIGIAARYGLTVDYLVALNDIPNKDRIYEGQRLKLVGKVQTTRKLVLPATDPTWTVYKLGRPCIKSNPDNVAGVLTPSRFGGLTYDILKDNENYIFEIQTEIAGRVQIYAGPETGAKII